MNEEIDIEELAPWLVILITLMGIGLRVLLLDYRGMGLDETFSVWLANHRVGDMLKWIVKLDQNPPLYYLLLHGWIGLNRDTPYYVRLLSVIFSAGTIPVIYLIAKRMSGVVMGLAAAVLLAFSPFHIRFAQETRMYTLLTFNAAWAIYALVRLLTDSRADRPIGSQFREYLHAWRTSAPAEPDNGGDVSSQDAAGNQTGWRAWIVHSRDAYMRRLPMQTVETDLAWVAFIVFSAATMLSHNTALLFPLATNVFVLGLMLFQTHIGNRTKESGPQPAFQAPSFGNWMKAQIGILLLWSPWAVAFIQQASRVYQAFWLPKPSWDTVLQALKTFLNAFTPTPDQAAGQMQVIWILYACVLCLGVLHYRKKISHFLFLVAMFAIPFLGELVVSLRRPIFCDRTLIWTTIPLFLILAAGIMQLKLRFLMIMMVGVLGTLNLFSAADYYRFMQKEDWSTPAGYVANFAQENDLILFNTALGQIPFDYYFKTYETLYAIQVEKRGFPVDIFDSGMLELKMAERDIPSLTSLMNEHNRIWLIYSFNGYTDPMNLIPQTLASKMELIRKRDFYGGQTQLYVTP